jgi:hypothetical protein
MTKTPTTNPGDAPALTRGWPRPDPSAAVAAALSCAAERWAVVGAAQQQRRCTSARDRV